MRRLTPALFLMALVTMVNSSGCTVGQELDPNEGRLRWIFSTPDPCSCSNVRIGGVNPRPVKRPYTPVFTDVLLRSRDAVRSHFKCENDACVLQDSGKSPCLNGGVCKDVAGDHSNFTCACTAHYTGDICQEPVWTLQENITQSGTHLKTNLKKLYNWTNSDDIRKIRVSLLRNGSSVVELVFNVTGVHENWFLQQNLIKSPQWPSLTSRTADSLKWFKAAIVVYVNSSYSSDCGVQKGWMAVVANRWLEECAWMHGWDAPIIMLYSLSNSPMTWADVVTEIPVSAVTSSSIMPLFPVSNVSDDDCETCFISGWQENVWISLKLDNPTKVGMVKLKICASNIKDKVTCPPYLSANKTSQDQCYHLSNATMNKSSAHQYCKDLSGDRTAEWKVVEIDDQQENTDIHSLFEGYLQAPGDTSIWLGYAENNGDWLSDSDQTNQTYFNWAGTEPGDQACLVMVFNSTSVAGLWQTAECSSDYRVVCEYTGDFGKTFSSARVLTGENNNATQASECGVPPSDDKPIHFYTCAEPRANASYVFVRKLTEYKDQLIICEVVVYVVNDSMVGIADMMTFETSTAIE